MIHTKHLTDLGFKTVYEYFEYIIESEINGQLKQAKQLISDLSANQKKDFIDYCDLIGNDYAETLQDYTVNIL